MSQILVDSVLRRSEIDELRRNPAFEPGHLVPFVSQRNIPAHACAGALRNLGVRTHRRLRSGIGRMAKGDGRSSGGSRMPLATQQPNDRAPNEALAL